MPMRPRPGSQRMYRHKDVESVLRIKNLLYKEGFTIAGARQQLRNEKDQTILSFPGKHHPNLKQIGQGLRDILALLSTRH